MGDGPPEEREDGAVGAEMSPWGGRRLCAARGARVASLCLGSVAAAIATAAYATAPAYSSLRAVVPPAGDGLAKNRRAHSTCSAVQLLASKRRLELCRRRPGSLLPGAFCGGRLGQPGGPGTSGGSECTFNRYAQQRRVVARCGGRSVLLLQYPFGVP